MLQNPEWQGKGIVVEQRGKQVVVLIPELAQETVIVPKSSLELNAEITLKAGNINLPELEVNFIEV